LCGVHVVPQASPMIQHGWHKNDFALSFTMT
jgi:hypothetical protein